MWLIFDPLVMSFVGLMFMQSMSFIVLSLPFGIMTVAQLVKAASAPGKDGLPKDDGQVGDMRRWHLVAVCLVTLATAASVTRFALGTETSIGSFASTVNQIDDIQLALAEISLWLVVGSAVFSFFYLNRLRRNGLPYAEFLWFGACVIPAAGFALSILATVDDFGKVVLVGVAGGVAYCAALLMPGGVPKVVVWTASCAALLIAMSDIVGPWNSAWLFVAIAAGYAAYRMEWKSAVQVSEEQARSGNAAEDSTNRREDAKLIRNTPTVTVRFFVFLSVFAAGALAMVLLSGSGPVIGGAVASEFVALISLAIAASSAALTAMALTVAGARWARFDDAAAVFVALLAAASVIHLIGAPKMDGGLFGTAVNTQYWNLVLGFYAVLGAGVVAFTTLTGKARQVRPFMVAIVIPAAFLLPSAELVPGELENAAIWWWQRVIEAGITMTMLSLMWYAFGPGRRRAPTPLTRTNPAAVST